MRDRAAGRGPVGATLRSGMTILALLIPVSLCMGAVGLGAFFWTLRAGQYDDLDGDGQRILYDEDAPLPPASDSSPKETTR